MHSVFVYGWTAGRSIPDCFCIWLMESEVSVTRTQLSTCIPTCHSNISSVCLKTCILGFNCVAAASSNLVSYLTHIISFCWTAVEKCLISHATCCFYKTWQIARKKKSILRPGCTFLMAEPVPLKDSLCWTHWMQKRNGCNHVRCCVCIPYVS